MNFFKSEIDFVKQKKVRLTFPGNYFGERKRRFRMRTKAFRLWKKRNFVCSLNLFAKLKRKLFRFSELFLFESSKHSTQTMKPHSRHIRWQLNNVVEHSSQISLQPGNERFQMIFSFRNSTRKIFFFLNFVKIYRIFLSIVDFLRAKASSNKVRRDFSANIRRRFGEENSSRLETRKKVFVGSNNLFLYSNRIRDKIRRSNRKRWNRRFRNDFRRKFLIWKERSSTEKKIFFFAFSTFGSFEIDKWPSVSNNEPIRTSDNRRNARRSSDNRNIFFLERKNLRTKIFNEKQKLFFYSESFSSKTIEKESKLRRNRTVWLFRRRSNSVKRPIFATTMTNRDSSR